MDDCHLKKHPKNGEKNPLHIIILKRLKTCNSSKNEHKVLHNENNIVKDLMKVFLNSH